MKYKTQELVGGLLDAAVSKAEGYPFRVTVSESLRTTLAMALGPNDDAWYPSQRWDHAGPLIERERITLEWIGGASGPVEWLSWCPGLERDERGPTPLIAMMRAYVRSKFGAEVDLSDV